MTDTTLPLLSSGSAISDGDLFITRQGADTSDKKVTGTQFKSYINALTFKTIATPSGTSPVADSTTDTLTLSNGAGISITGNATTDTVTIASTITQYTDDLARDAVGAHLLTTTSITPIYSGGYFSWYFTGHVPSGLFFDSKNKFNLTADINELDISGISINLITPDNDGWYIRGIRTDVVGHEVRLINASDSYFFFLSNEDPSSDPSYQMLLPYTEVKIPPRQGVILFWDKGVNKWRLSDTVSLQTISGTSPIAVDNTDPENPIVSMAQSASGVDGYLSGSDWDTFNSKMTGSLTSAHIFVGNGSGVATDVAMSGDVTISNTGATTIANDAVTFAKMQNISTGNLLGRTTAASGNTEEITPDTNFFSMSAGALGFKTNADDTQVLYQNGSAINGMAGLVSDANGAPVVIENITQTAPSSGVQLYSNSNAGRRMLGQKEVTGDDYRFQPFLGDHVCRYWFPYGGGVTTLFAGGITIAYTGSTNSVTPATTTYFTSRNRINNVSGAAAGSSAAGRHNGLIVTRGDAAGIGGFYWTFEGGNADAATVANGRMFAGLYGTNSAIGNVATNSLLNMVGFGWDTGDGNIQFYTNDGSGTASKTDLGSTFPANTLSVDWYKFEIWCAPNASTIYWKCTRKNTGDVTSGSVSSDLPTNTVYMAPQVWINNGTTALARTFAYGPMYLECFT